MRVICILLILLYASNYLFAQHERQYIDDLDKDFRYKVEATTLDDRGIEFFKNDIEKELNKSQAFKNIGIYKERVSFIIRFMDSIQLDYIRVYGLNKQPVVGLAEKNLELTQILNNLKIHWKPAEYAGKIFQSNKYNSVNFHIQCDEIGKISIGGLTFSKSIERNLLDSTCFKYVEPISAYGNPLFYSTEITAEYKGGEKILKSNLNALLKPTSNPNSIIDYFSVDFVITKDARLAYFITNDSVDSVKSIVLDKMKLLSCNWKPALSSGRKLNMVLSYKFYYSYILDDNQKRVNIEILDIITRDVPLQTKIKQDI